MNDPQIQQKQDRSVHSQQQDEIFNLSDYDEGSSEEIIVEFARNSYPLLDAVIEGTSIKGQFGYGEIQQPRNQRLVMIQNGKIKLIEKVSKIIVTKSVFKKKQAGIKQTNKDLNQERNIKQNSRECSKNQKEAEVPEKMQQIEQKFFSQISESSDSQQQQRQNREAKNSLRVRQQKKRSLATKTADITKPQKTGKQAKLNKNILKKKLKFLSTKK